MSGIQPDQEPPRAPRAVNSEATPMPPPPRRSASRSTARRPAKVRRLLVQQLLDPAQRSAQSLRIGAGPAQRQRGLKRRSDGIRVGLQRFRCISLRSAALHGGPSTVYQPKCVGFRNRSIVERRCSRIRLPPPPRFSLAIFRACKDCSELQQILAASSRDRLLKRRASGSARDPKLRALGARPLPVQAPVVAIERRCAPSGCASPASPGFPDPRRPRSPT